ncbi:MAG: site-specific DNA-methyltransferase [Leptolyngbyaceae cyanobacterium RM2_2_4]|nr:site-specific DNA-methyltransferase [Leptolyngbyaceae cyanobacterium RM2_2_4]
MWYDLDHHEFLSTIASKLGFKVCRWPVVWCKTSACLNQAASYNFTKATEVCMVLRRSEDVTLANKQSTNFIVGPSVNSRSHPFHKPSYVWEKLINAVSYPGQTIVDPFAGSGSLILPAVKMERVPVATEIDDLIVYEGVKWLYQELNDKRFLDPLF